MKIPAGRLTNWIAAVTAVFFLLLWALGQIDTAAIVGGFIPGRLSGDIDYPGAVPAILTPLTATLLHASFFHLGANLLLLFFCGRFVEHAVGPKLTIALYILGAYVSAATQFLLDPHALMPMVGASGAISALFGSYAVLYARRRPADLGPLPGSVVQILWLGIAWVLIQYMSGIALSSGGYPIAIGAHVGGFVFGTIAARPMLRIRYRTA